MSAVPLEFSPPLLFRPSSFDRLNDRVHHTEAPASAEIELLSDDISEKLNRMDRDAEVERLLTDIKLRRRLLPAQN